MKFNITGLKTLISEFDSSQKTGNKFLDDRYEEQVGIVGKYIPYYRFFYHLSRALKPNFVVELGSFQGTAAAHLAAGNPKGNVITIDIHKDDKDAQLRTRGAAATFENLLYVNEWTYDAIEKLDFPDPIDILFIDSWHRLDKFTQDWDDYYPLVGSPGLIIIDDVFNTEDFPEMLDTWEGLPGKKFIDIGLHNNVPMGFIHVTKPSRKVNTAKQSDQSSKNPPTTKRTSRSSKTSPVGELSTMVIPSDKGK